MYRFFVEEDQVGEELIHIRGADKKHMKNVLRLRQGEEVSISTGGKKEYRCEVAAYLEDEVLLRIRFIKEEDYELPARILLFQGLPKGDKMELIIQKAVELGAGAVVPVAMDRCVVKLDKKKAANKVKRWKSIAEAAAKQAKRMYVPEVGEVVSFEEALQQAKACDVLLMPYELERGMDRTREVLANIKPGMTIGVFIGPEGGFSPREAAMAREEGARLITLGKRILRTETAGMASLSILLYLLEEA